MFWDNLKAICDSKGIKVSPLLTELGMSTGSIGKWQKGGKVSSDNIIALAQRLDVSTDALLLGEEKKSVQPANALQCAGRSEENLLLMYRELPDGMKQLCDTYIKGLYDAYQSTLPGEKLQA